MFGLLRPSDDGSGDDGAGDEDGSGDEDKEATESEKGEILPLFIFAICSIYRVSSFLILTKFC